METNESVWRFWQQFLDYTDEQMKMFKENRRNENVLSNIQALNNKTIILEVVESHGCLVQHKVGNKLYFDGGGNIITKLCPRRICTYALSSAAPILFTVQELFYAGIDPNEMRFKRVSCPDVGVKCGGWGSIVMELHIEDRKNV